MGGAKQTTRQDGGDHEERGRNSESSNTGGIWCEECKSVFNSGFMLISLHSFNVQGPSELPDCPACDLFTHRASTNCSVLMLHLLYRITGG